MSSSSRPLQALAGQLEGVLRSKREQVNQARAYMQYEDDDHDAGLTEIEVPGQPERNLYIFEGVLTSAECKQLISIAESSSLFQHHQSPKNDADYAYRDHHRIKFESTSIAKTLWEETCLSKAFERCIRHDSIRGKAVGLSPCIRLYRYRGMERFGRHIDGSETVGKGRTEYTVLFYLSTTQGGETVFYDDGGHLLASVVPVQGRVVVHRHGDTYCLDHEALEVTDGTTKYILRTDVVFESTA
jgi:hypothetical protein